MIWADKLILAIAWILLGVGFISQVVAEGGGGLHYLMQGYGAFLVKGLLPIWFVLRGIDLIFARRLRR